MYAYQGAIPLVHPYHHFVRRPIERETKFVGGRFFEPGCPVADAGDPHFRFIKDGNDDVPQGFRAHGVPDTIVELVE